MKLFTVVITVLAIACASITKFEQLPINGASVMHQGFYMFDKRLAVPNSSPSYIELLIKVAKENKSQDAHGTIQGVVLSKAAFDAMGYEKNNTKMYCCDKNAKANGLCEEERKFILPKKYGDQLAESTIVFSGEKKYLSTRLVIPKEGLYYYVIGSCDPDTTNAVLSGYSVTFNPYGHLPATLYGVYPFTKIVIWLYLFLSCYWFFRCWKYSQSLIIIHRIISLTLVSFIVSLMVFNFHLFTMNRLGSANSFLSFLSVFTASLAQGVFRILLFYISLGYGSVYNVSNMSSSLSVFLVIIYTLLNTSFKLNQETQNPVSISSTLIPALFEAMILFVIFSYAMDTIKKLKEKNETTKLSSFRTLLLVMGIVFVLVFVLNVYLLTVDMDALFARFWKWQWM